MFVIFYEEFKVSGMQFSFITSVHTVTTIFFPPSIDIL